MTGAELAGGAVPSGGGPLARLWPRWLRVGIRWPDRAGDEAWGVAPRWYPGDAAIDAHHAASFGGPGGVILVDGVVVRT